MTKHKWRGLLEASADINDTKIAYYIVFKYQLCVHYGIQLVHKGDVVTVKGEIMQEPKVSTLSARDRYYIARVH